MKHYRSSDGKFELDIPESWQPVSTGPRSSTPNAVIRFASDENGQHRLTIFRIPYDSRTGAEAFRDGMQQKLAQGGFGHFAKSETAIGPKRVPILDFDKPAATGGTWSCRHYFVFNGALVHALGFGTDRREAMFGLYEQIAKSFVTG
jgi:hypothetical protein